MNTSKPTESDPVAGALPPARVSTASGVRRRDVLVGGIAGLSSLVAGGVIGRALDREDRELNDERAAAWTSYAQFGEDLVTHSLFLSLSISKPSYLDIGASEPIRFSNTFLFYERGSTGVLVEPNVDLSDKIRRLRPQDKLLVAGIGVDDLAEADYYIMTHPDLNTFDKRQVKHLEDTTEQRLVRVVKMPLININRVMVEHFGGSAPDLLSIDIEGLDYDVLKTLDYTRFRPKVICAETIITATNKHNPKTPELMAEKGYELRGMTYPNMFFVDKQLLPK
ncbi:MAG: FkbM family methyltransferase [Planctomycetia bacterium]|nr:FkbM family methyltransferase [Planctomycetia bacterium]